MATKPAISSNGTHTLTESGEGVETLIDFVISVSESLSRSSPMSLNIVKVKVFFPIESGPPGSSR